MYKMYKTASRGNQGAVFVLGGCSVCGSFPPIDPQGDSKVKQTGFPLLEFDRNDGVVILVAILTTINENR
jgi:hypothetical protein